MAIENLRVVMDGVNSGLIKSLDQVGTSAETNMAKAETSTGKMSGAMSALSANALPIAGAIGAGLIKLGLSFADQAIAAGKFATQTGLSVEEASKLTNVSEDLGVSTESLGTAMNKMLVNAGKTPQAFSDLGVAIVKTKSGAVDTEATFLGLIDRLKGITDPAERAATGAKLLGKSWASVAPLIDEGSASLREMMDSTPKGDIFHQSDVEQAKQMKAALHDLGDAMQSLGNSVGKTVVPSITAFAKGLTVLAAAAQPAFDKMDEGNKMTSALIANLNGAQSMGYKMGGSFDTMAKAAQGYGQGLIDYAAAQANSTTSTEQAEQAQKDFAAATKTADAAVKQSTDRVKGYMDALKAERNAAIDAIDSQHGYRDAQLDTADGAAKLTAAIAENMKVIKSSKSSDDDKAQALRNIAEAINEQEGKMEDQAAAYAKSKGAADGSTQAIQLQIESLYAQAGALAPNSPLRERISEYINQLQHIPTSINTTITTTGADDTKGTRGQKALGGSFKAGDVDLVGENGPEIVQWGSSGTVIPNGQSMAMLGGSGGSSAPVYNITINAGLGTNGQSVGAQIMEEIAKYNRQHGIR